MSKILNSFVFWFNFLKYPVLIILFFVIYFFSFVLLYGLYIKKSKNYFKKFDNPVKLKKYSLLFELLVLVPKQYTRDLISRPKDFFRPQGLIVFEGSQGNGKTSSMIHYVMQMQQQYKKCKVLTNLAYKHENMELNHWKGLVNYKNGIYGVIAVLDELQNWFSSNESRNFPPEMLQTITQNRKNRRIILGTAQNFYLLAKAIRSQCTEVRKCFTLFGCFTFVFRKRPILDSEGNVKEWKRLGFYHYVHFPYLRNSYDTWKCIDNLQKAGFQERSVLDLNVPVNISVKK
ncbi:MAG: zonular occludens toxin domain-containing protein [Bacillota bacterium]|nr:zonular occludens toxin domain-containing protein [Bacillota bacterium]